MTELQKTEGQTDVKVEIVMYVDQKLTAAELCKGLAPPVECLVPGTSVLSLIEHGHPVPALVDQHIGHTYPDIKLLSFSLLPN